MASSGNFCTWNRVQVQGAAQGLATLTKGNILATHSGSSYGQMMGNMGVKTGKWYIEWYISNAGFPSWLLGWTRSNRLEAFTGSNQVGVESLAYVGYFTGSKIYLSSFGSNSVYQQQINLSSWTSAGDAPTTGDVVMCAIDFDAGKGWWGQNGEWGDVGSGTGNPATGANASVTFTAANYANDFKTPIMTSYQGAI